jgi:hypothetical protein
MFRKTSLRQCIFKSPQQDCPENILKIMTSSLEVERDKHGYFRHRDGHSLVVIFDSKNEDKTPHAISWQEPVIGPHTHKPKGDEMTLDFSMMAVDADSQ